MGGSGSNASRPDSGYMSGVVRSGGGLEEYVNVGVSHEPSRVVNVKPTLGTEYEESHLGSDDDADDPAEGALTQALKGLRGADPNNVYIYKDLSIQVPVVGGSSADLNLPMELARLNVGHYYSTGRRKSKTKKKAQSPEYPVEDWRQFLSSPSGKDTMKTTAAQKMRNLRLQTDDGESPWQTQMDEMVLLDTADLPPDPNIPVSERPKTPSPSVRKRKKSNSRPSTTPHFSRSPSAAAKPRELLNPTVSAVHFNGPPAKSVDVVAVTRANSRAASRAASRAQARSPTATQTNPIPDPSDGTGGVIYLDKSAEISQQQSSGESNSFSTRMSQSRRRRSQNSTVRASIRQPPSIPVSKEATQMNEFPAGKIKSSKTGSTKVVKKSSSKAMETSNISKSKSLRHGGGFTMKLVRSDSQNALGDQDQLMLKGVASAKSTRTISPHRSTVKSTFESKSSVTAETTGGEATSEEAQPAPSSSTEEEPTVPADGLTAASTEASSASTQSRSKPLSSATMKRQERQTSVKPTLPEPPEEPSPPQSPADEEPTFEEVLQDIFATQQHPKPYASLLANHDEDQTGLTSPSNSQRLNNLSSVPPIVGVQEPDARLNSAASVISLSSVFRPMTADDIDPNPSPKLPVRLQPVPVRKATVRLVSDTRKRDPKHPYKSHSPIISPIHVQSTSPIKPVHSHAHVTPSAAGYGSPNVDLAGLATPAAHTPVALEKTQMPNYVLEAELSEAGGATTVLEDNSISGMLPRMDGNVMTSPSAYKAYSKAFSFRESPTSMKSPTVGGKYKATVGQFSVPRLLASLGNGSPSNKTLHASRSDGALGLRSAAAIAQSGTVALQKKTLTHSATTASLHIKETSEDHEHTLVKPQGKEDEILQLDWRRMLKPVSKATKPAESEEVSKSKSPVQVPRFRQPEEHSNEDPRKARQRAILQKKRDEQYHTSNRAWLKDRALNPLSYIGSTFCHIMLNKFDSEDGAGQAREQLSKLEQDLINLGKTPFGTPSITRQTLTIDEKEKTRSEAGSGIPRKSPAEEKRKDEGKGLADLYNEALEKDGSLSKPIFADPLRAISSDIDSNLSTQRYLNMEEQNLGSVMRHQNAITREHQLTNNTLKEYQHFVQHQIRSAKAQLEETSSKREKEIEADVARWRKMEDENDGLKKGKAKDDDEGTAEDDRRKRTRRGTLIIQVSKSKLSYQATTTKDKLWLEVSIEDPAGKIPTLVLKSRKTHGTDPSIAFSGRSVSIENADVQTMIIELKALHNSGKGSVKLMQCVMNVCNPLSNRPKQLSIATFMRVPCYFARTDG